MELRQVVIEYINLVWPGYRGKLVPAMKALAEVKRHSGMSPGTREYYDLIRRHLEKEG